MLFEGRTLDDEQAKRVETDTEYLEDLLFEGEPESDLMVDLDKAWHGIHWLLAGSAWEADSPAGWAVLGGREVGEDQGYGPARLLDPEAVRQVASALDGVTSEALGQRMDRSAMAAAELYPMIWDEDDVFETYLAPSYDKLRSFYLDAAAAGSWVLLSIL